MDVLIVSHVEFGRVLPNRKLVFVKDPIGVNVGVSNLYMVIEEYGAKVTLAVCPEVASYVPLPATAHYEVGLHVHPGWEEFELDGIKYFAGDSFLRKHVKQSSTSTVLPSYSFDEQSEMIDVGINRLIQVLGEYPKMFVAGRWAVNNDTMRALAKSGITRECSAQAGQKTDHYDWSQLARICMPYMPSRENYQRTGELPVVEIPISRGFRGIHATIEDRRPVGMDWLKLTFEEYYRRRQKVFHLCFHSPAMTDKFYIDRLDEFLKFVVGHRGIEFKYASEITV